MFVTVAFPFVVIGRICFVTADVPFGVIGRLCFVTGALCVGGGGEVWGLEKSCYFWGYWPFAGIFGVSFKMTIVRIGV